MTTDKTTVESATPNRDPYFRVEMIRATPNPQQVIYAAMHQDYSDEFVADGCVDWPNESKSGEIVVKRLLSGNRGHYGPLENPQITFNCGWFPHSTMQQIRTHRVGISFDVQSFRYTGKRIYELGVRWRNVTCSDDIKRAKALANTVFYVRPAGTYTDRQGKKYDYTEDQRNGHVIACLAAALRYADDIDAGLSEEHARGLIPFDVRQHWVMSVNVRSLMHLLDLRWKADAQLEAQQLCDLIYPHFERWVPAIADWYLEHRAHKARLAP